MAKRVGLTGQKKLSLRAFSLVEVLLCVTLLGFLIVSVALPQLYALRVVAQVRILHQVNRALDNLACGLAGSNDPGVFIQAWRRDLRQRMPGINVKQGILYAHHISLEITWPMAPGMLAIGTATAHNTLTRTVYF